MNITRSLLLVCGFIVVQSRIMAQQDFFYYYNGEKIYLQIDSTSIVVIFDGDVDSTVIHKHHNQSLKWRTHDNAQQKQYEKNVMPIVSVYSMPQNRGEYEIVFNDFKKVKGVSHVLPTFKRNGNRVDVTGNFYVKLFSESDISVLEQTAKRHGIEILGKNEYMPLWYTLSCAKSSLNPIEAANLFYEMKLFEYAEPAFYMYDMMQSADTFYEDQWNLKNRGQNNGMSNVDINIESAWNYTKGNDIVVAVVDCGIDLSHPDLANNICDVSFDAVSVSPGSVIWGGHGTACAGIIGAIQNNNIGISGVAPECKLMSISCCFGQILESYGVYINEASMLANAINFAWNNGADVISNSWGGGAESSIINDAITAALTQGREGLGCVVVFSAGNARPNEPKNVRYPANSNPDILCVGALSPCGERKNPNSCDGEQWHSCYGSELDIMAPGVLIPTTYINSSENDYVIPTDYGYYHTAFNGTSAACPHVAGVAALILGANLELTAKEVNNLIEVTAKKIRPDFYSYATTVGRTNGTWHNEVGYGLLDATLAVRSARPLGVISDSIIMQSVVGRIEVTGTNVLLRDVNIKKTAEVTIKAEKNVTLRPRIIIEKGALVKTINN